MKKSEILFLIVSYFLFLLIGVVVILKRPNVIFSLEKQAIYYSWFLIAGLGYMSRKWWKGAIIGFLFWSSFALMVTIWMIYTHEGDAIIGVFIDLGLAIVGGVVGAISGYIGSRLIRSRKIREIEIPEEGQ